LRVLHLIPNMLAGGAQQQLTYLAAEQVRLGHDVHVGFLHDGPKRVLLDATGAKVERFTARGNHDPRLFLRIRSLIRRLRPDVVQTWLVQMDVLGGAAALATRTPWVLSERVSGDAYGPDAKSALRAWLARRADVVVSNSRKGDRYWAATTPAVPRRVVRNGIPLGAIDAVAPVSDERTGLRAGERMILYAGRLNPQKNLENLIPALGAATAAGASVAFLCGDGTHEAQARARVSALGLGGRVRVMGFVDDVWSWMKRADVFVSISHFEGHPNTVLEAAASGAPLVLSDIPEHREVLDEAGALFVDRTSQDAIAAALEGVLRDPADARRRAQAARTAVETLSVEAMARGYDEVYADALAHRAERP
jgi:glycosyltransferase involved in cell wall biosynthesis